MSLSNLQFIHGLINKNVIENNGQSLQTVLITVYANKGNIECATNVFNEIENSKKDIVSVCALMTVLHCNCMKTFKI